MNTHSLRTIHKNYRNLTKLTTEKDTFFYTPIHPKIRKKTQRKNYTTNKKGRRGRRGSLKSGKKRQQLPQFNQQQKLQNPFQFHLINSQLDMKSEESTKELQIRFDLCTNSLARIRKGRFFQWSAQVVQIEQQQLLSEWQLQGLPEPQF